MEITSKSYLSLSVLVECGKMLQKGTPKLNDDGSMARDDNGKIIYEPYKIKVLNTINFARSMHYNPRMISLSPRYTGSGLIFFCVIEE